MRVAVLVAAGLLFNLNCLTYTLKREQRTEYLYRILIATGHYMVNLVNFFWHGSFRKKFDMSIRKTHTKTFGIRDSEFGVRDSEFGVGSKGIRDSRRRGSGFGVRDSG